MGRVQAVATPEAHALESSLVLVALPRYPVAFGFVSCSEPVMCGGGVAAGPGSWWALVLSEGARKAPRLATSATPVVRKRRVGRVGVVLAEAAYWGALVLMGVSFLSSLGWAFLGGC